MHVGTDLIICNEGMPGILGLTDGEHDEPDAQQLKEQLRLVSLRMIATLGGAGHQSTDHKGSRPCRGALRACFEEFSGLAGGIFKMFCLYTKSSLI